MLFYRLDPRAAATIRLVGVTLIVWSVVNGHPVPATSGRGLVVLISLVIATVAFLVWAARPLASGMSIELWAMATAGGVLTGAANHTAASAFVFVAVVAAGIRRDMRDAIPLVLAATFALGVAVLLYSENALGLLAYALGFTAAQLAAANSRQVRERAEQAELLLAQTQRSQEEQLRVARLEESTRIAREIHDVLAHALAGLTIQLEATRSLVEQGAERETVLARLTRAHELAREGLVETRRAVGALRGEGVAVPEAIRALVATHRAGDNEVALTFDGDPDRLTGSTGLAVLRTVQEALTNAGKHAPGTPVSVVVHAGARPDDDVLATIRNHRGDDEVSPLAGAGGGYGLRGMRERAQALGGTLTAGESDDAWQVSLRLPAPGAGTATS